MESPLQRIIKGQPVIPGAPETKITKSFRIKNIVDLIKPKKEYVIYKEKSGWLQFYGRESHQQNIWVPNSDDAYKYTKKEAKDMCKIWPFCNYMKIT